MLYWTHNNVSIREHLPELPHRIISSRFIIKPTSSSSVIVNLSEKWWTLSHHLNLLLEMELFQLFTEQD